MPAISAGNLTLLRTQPHRTNLHMVVQAPQIVLAAMVNDASIARGAMSITFDGDSWVGGYWTGVTKLQEGMTLWVGSSAGAKNLGQVRLISAAGAVLSVAENWDIAWANNLYLSVVKQWRLWSVEPREVPNKATGGVTWYTDYDDTYSDQNEDFRPVPIMGPHRVGVLSAGTVAIAFNFSGSYAVKPGETIASYLTVSESGAVSDPASPTPTITYSAVTGHKGDMVKLTVTDTHGKTEVGYRFVFIMDTTGANAPFNDFDMEECRGVFDEGGWKASFVVKETDVTEAAFPDGALIVVYANDWYGATAGSIGGNCVGAENIVYVGTIVKETVEFDALRQGVSFESRGIVGDMQDCEGDPFVLEDDATPDYWYQMNGVTMHRVALFYARYMSTLIHIADFNVSTWANTEEAVFWEVPGGSLYEQIGQCIYDDGKFFRLLADRMSRVWAAPNINLISSADRAGIATIMEVTKLDRLGVVRVEQEAEPKASYVEASGVYYAGGGATPKAYMSGAPGPAKARRGSSVTTTNLLVTSQANCNAMAGYLFGRLNNEFPAVSLTLTGNYRIFDIVPQEYVLLDLAAADNNRGLVWSDKKLIPRSVTFGWRSGQSMLVVSMECETYVLGAAGQTIPIPPSPDDDWPLPPAPLPPVPIEPPPPPTDESDASGIYVVGCYGYTGGTRPGILRTEELGGFQATTPTWATWNTGIDASYLWCRDLICDPWHPTTRLYALVSNANPGMWDDCGLILYRREYSAGWGSWTAILNEAIIESTLGYAIVNGSGYIGRPTGNINAEGHLYVMVTVEGAMGWCPQYFFKSTTYGTTWTATEMDVQPENTPQVIPMAMRAGMLKGTSSYGAGQVLYASWRNRSVNHYPAISVSHTQGTAWAFVDGGDNMNRKGVKIMVDPNDQSILYALECTFMYEAGHVWRYSDDGGTIDGEQSAWGSVSYAPVVRSGDAPRIMAASTTVIKASDDGGITVYDIAVTGSIAGGGLWIGWHPLKLTAHHSLTNSYSGSYFLQMTNDGGLIWYNKHGNMAGDFWGLVNAGFSLVN